MAQSDLDFTFDTSFFKKGIGEVVKGFSGMEVTAAKVAKGVNRGLTSIIGKVGLVFAGFKSVKTALLDMPEVGQAFGIAKNVFLKNLLFPLRKEIFPLLQDMLDWVRDSRVRFVRWGQALANVFRSVVSGVKNIIEFVQQMSVRVSDIAARIFGDRIQSIEDIFNLVTFKIATVVQFATLLIQDIGSLFKGFIFGVGDIGPALQGIIDRFGEFIRIFTESNEQGDSLRSVLNTVGEIMGGIARFAAEMTRSFLDGFVPAVKDIFTPIQRIFDAFSGIFNLVFGTSEQLGKWGDLFESIGAIIGRTILATFETIALVVEKIETIIGQIQEKGFSGFLGDAFSFLGEGGRAGRERIRDGIVKPDGTVIQTDPKDTLVALKNEDTSLAGLIGNIPTAAPAVERNNVINVDFTGLQVIVEGGSEEQGREVAMGFVDQMRQEFNRDFERFGIG